MVEIRKSTEYVAKPNTTATWPELDKTF